MNFCVDCKHCKPCEVSHAHMCTRKSHINYVTGNTVSDREYCYDERRGFMLAYFFGKCGEQARFFEPKDVVEEEQKDVE